jgi:hypothetical protein
MGHKNILDLHIKEHYAVGSSRAQSCGPRWRKEYLVEQRSSESRIDPTVFYVSLVAVLAFVAWGALTDATAVALLFGGLSGL